MNLLAKDLTADEYLKDVMQVLSRLIRTMRELALLGEEIDGKTAASIGLVYKSVPDKKLEAETDNLSRKLLSKPSTTMALIKRGLEGSLDMTLDQVLAWEAAHQSIMLKTAELKGAVHQFLKLRGKAFA